MGIFWARFSRNPLALTGATIVGLLVLVAIFAPWIAPYNPLKIDTYHILEPPSWAHLFGTDALGRDCLSRIIYGARISLMVGLVAVGLSTAVGTILGAIAGYFGGWIDALIMRAVDVMLCFPTIFLIMAVIAFLQPSIINIMVVIGLTSWMGVARLVRAEFLSLRQRDFVKAARLVGMSPTRIIFSEILPNAVAPILVSATLGVGAAILTESALSFLGIGVQPPTPSWGNMLTAGKDNLEIAWWLSVFPGLAILITVLGFNLLGEGLRDALDPRLQVKLKTTKKRRISFKHIFSTFAIIVFILGISISSHAETFLISQNVKNKPEVPLPIQKIPGSKVKIGPQQVTPAWQLIWNRAREMAKQGDLQGAIALYQELLTQRPGLIQAKWELAQLLAKTGQKVQAVNLIEQYLEVWPHKLKARLLLADLLVELGQYDRAQKIYLDLINKFNKKHDNNSIFYIYLQLANIAFIQNDLELCLNYLTKAKAINPKNKNLNLMFSYCLQALGDDQSALIYFKKIESYFKNDPNFLKHYALCLIENNKIKKAAKILNLYLKHNINSNNEKWAQRQLIRLYLMDGDESDAIKALETWLQQKNDPFLERRLARLYFANQEYLKALNTFESLLDLYPKDLESLRFIGRIYLLFRLYKPALDIYNQIFSIRPDPDTRFTLIKLYYFTKQYQKALSLLNQDILPRFFISTNDQKILIKIYIKNKQFNKARELINNLLSFYPNDIELLKSLLSIEISNGINKKNIKTIFNLSNKIISISPESLIIPKIITKVYEQGYKNFSRKLCINTWLISHSLWSANRIIYIDQKTNDNDLLNDTLLLIKVVPNNFKLRLTICKYFAKNADIKQLKIYFPKDIPIFWTRDFDIIRALALVRSGYFRSAFSILSDILTDEPNNILGRKTLYYLYQEEGMDIDAKAQKIGLKILDPKIKLSIFDNIRLSNHILPTPKRAMQNPQLVSSLTTTELIDLLKDYGPNESLSLLLSILYTQKKQIDEAIASFDIFIKNYPSNLAAKIFYAKWLSKIGYNKKANYLITQTINLLKNYIKYYHRTFNQNQKYSRLYLFNHTNFMWQWIKYNTQINWLNILSQLTM